MLKSINDNLDLIKPTLLMFNIILSKFYLNWHKYFINKKVDIFYN